VLGQFFSQKKALKTLIKLSPLSNARVVSLSDQTHIAHEKIAAMMMRMR